MKKAFTVLFILLLVGVVLALKWTNFGSQVFLSPPEIIGGVLRTEGESGGRLYYLTSQWEKRISQIGGGRASSSMRTVG